MPNALLRALQVEHLGPIERASLEFAEGLNVLTGETGAGKTLLIGALTLCAGESDARGLKRVGALRVSALFDCDGSEVSLSREGSDRERLKSTVDGLVVSAKALAERAAPLMVIYGQASSQRLRAPAEALRVIDDFGKVDTRALTEARRELTRAEADLATLGGDAFSRDREVELLSFQLRELEDARLVSADELETVLHRLTVLTALRENRRNLMEASALLSDDDLTSAAAQLHRASRSLDPIESMAPVAVRLRELSLEAADIARDIAAQAESASSEDYEFEALELRATQLHALARKYGGSIAEALSLQQQFRLALDRFESDGDRAGKLETDVRRLRDLIDVESARVRAERETAARQFTEAVVRQLSRVALPAATLEVDVAGVDGSNVTMLFSSDRRRPVGPLHQLASGGELARVLLAISLETLSEGAVTVFDEVDAGIGGAVAEQIGECLQELARRQQVLVVTHLASIAALADRHFVVRGSSTESSSAAVESVTGNARVAEIARMLAGESAPQEARALAEQLLARRGSPI